MRGMARDTLVHFLVLGGIMLGAFTLLQERTDPAPPPTEIRYTVDDVAQLLIGFEAQWNRQPTQQEFNALVEDRVRQDILYREALALGLDKDDEIVRRRMAQKMQFLAEDLAAVREPTTDDLKAWYADNKDMLRMAPRLSFRHLPNGLSGQRIGFPGLELTITEAVVRVALLDGRTWMGIARPSEPWVELAADRGVMTVAKDFMRQGIEHILSGFDHLVFVFGLMLLVPGRWMLVKTITAFTVAHSITLGIATFGYVRPPAVFIEAAIAMSIVFLGVEIVRARRGETGFAIERPWLMSFAFGLLHGFGFATALADAGLPQSDIPIALLFFNIGVEIGQLAFVGLVLLMSRSLTRLYGSWPRSLQILPAYLVGTLGNRQGRRRSR